MTISSISGRTSDLMRAQHMLAALQRNTAQLDAVQQQINTGRKLSAASDDPVAASHILNLSDLLGQLSQHADNTTQAGNLLSAADAAMGDAVDLLREAHTVAMDSVNATSSDADRQAAVQQLNTMIDQLQRIANRQYQGRYLFDGQAGGGDPFTSVDGRVAYAGGQSATRFALDSNWTLESALDGVTVFGGESQSAGSMVSLMPRASAATPLTGL
ncbi:MAG: flagellar hook-associated protein FlgL, partial [Phycisphaerae bacterium]|nr:flagellar hook-associated protein FlgL [Phycisphaerae bacterium]